MSDVLTLEHLKAALETDRNYQPMRIYYCLHAAAYENYKVLLNMTDEDMTKQGFVKTDYLTEG